MPRDGVCDHSRLCGDCFSAGVVERIETERDAWAALARARSRMYQHAEHGGLLSDFNAAKQAATTAIDALRALGIDPNEEASHA